MMNVTLTESDQDTLDTLIFGLSTPSNTKKFDVVTPNLVTESQWSFPDSQFPPDFPDAKVRELEAAKVREVKHKSPVKRDIKKSKIFRSPYITKFGSSSKDEGSSDNEEKQRYAFDGYTIYEDMPNQLINDYSQWLELRLLKYHASKKQTDNHYLKNAPGLGYPLLDFIVAQALSKNWFYLMTQSKMCWNDELGLQTDEISHDPFDVEYVQNIPQQASDSLDCGVFVAAYVEILSEGQQVPSCEFEAASQRARYASLLWHYEVTKTKKGYMSDNDDPPHPKNTFLQSPDESAIVTLE
ncbi:hypothetical protein CQW23_11383 [Capsicum baccatum]|uniref:Ubiquitin-like protease family profile domain-containing protein n=1 Tax=Capsicum baccatum TaxID=33114 RepID=A0A2G2WPK7_CAPBA|nr:hypothetical protein CQW23_11383 [Capsicum baccatum]